MAVEWQEVSAVGAQARESAGSCLLQQGQEVQKARREHSSPSLGPGIQKNDFQFVVTARHEHKTWAPMRGLTEVLLLQAHAITALLHHPPPPAPA